MCLPTGGNHHFSKRGSALRFEQTEQRSALCSGSRGACKHYRLRSFKNSICFAGAGHDGSLHSEAPAQCRCSHHPKPRKYSEAVARRRGCVMTVLAMLELRSCSSLLCSNDSVKFEDDFQLARSAMQRACVITHAHWAMAQVECGWPAIEVLFQFSRSGVAESTIYGSRWTIFCAAKE